MTQVRVHIDMDAVGSILATPAMMRAVGDAAEAIADYAVAAAPVNTGAYVDSIAATSPVIEEGVATAKVVTDDFAWHLVEYGSVNNPPYRPMRTGVERAGLQFKDGE